MLVATLTYLWRQIFAFRATASEMQGELPRWIPTEMMQKTFDRLTLFLGWTHGLRSTKMWRDL